MERKMYKIQGFPEIGEKVELPNIATLLAMPWFYYASADDVYKYGGEVYRKLLDKTPISGKKKNVMVTSRVQYLNPSKMSIKYAGRWHTDSNGFPLAKEDNDLVHLLISKCTAITEFNTTPMMLEGFNAGTTQQQFNNYLNDNWNTLGIKEESIETERFVTFDHRHIHRAVQATEQEFRFMYRVIETNDFEPNAINASLVNVSYSYNDFPDGSQRLIDAQEKVAEYTSIAKVGGKIVVQL